MKRIPLSTLFILLLVTMTACGPKPTSREMPKRAPKTVAPLEAPEQKARTPGKLDVDPEPAEVTPQMTPEQRLAAKQALEARYVGSQAELEAYAEKVAKLWADAGEPDSDGKEAKLWHAVDHAATAQDFESALPEQWERDFKRVIASAQDLRTWAQKMRELADQAEVLASEGEHLGQPRDPWENFQGNATFADLLDKDLKRFAAEVRETSAGLQDETAVLYKACDIVEIAAEAQFSRTGRIGKIRDLSQAAKFLEEFAESVPKLEVEAETSADWPERVRVFRDRALALIAPARVAPVKPTKAVDEKAEVENKQE